MSIVSTSSLNSKHMITTPPSVQSQSCINKPVAIASCTVQWRVYYGYPRGCAIDVVPMVFSFVASEKGQRYETIPCKASWRGSSRLDGVQRSRDLQKLQTYVLGEAPLSTYRHAAVHGYIWQLCVFFQLPRETQVTVDWYPCLYSHCQTTKYLDCSLV